jgi:uncharacterized membrane protein YbhN (UPF0104 family)
MGRSLPRQLRRVLGSSYLEQAPAHMVVFVAVAAALAIGALFALASAAGLEQVADRLGHPHWLWLPLALGATAAGYLGYIVAYREAAYAEHGPQPSLRHIGALVAGGFGLFVPRGGFTLDLDALRLAGVSSREARVRTLTLGMLEYAVLAPSACVVAVLLLVRDWPDELGVRLSWAIGVPLGALVALWLLRHRAALAGAGGWRGSIAHGLDAIVQTVSLWRRPDRGLLAFAGMCAYWAADIFVLWACLAVFSPHRPPGVEEIVLGYATGYALTRRALPLAGAGAVEALLPLALTWTGVALATAVISVFAYRLFNLWLPLVPAAAAVFLLRRANRRSSA